MAWQHVTSYLGWRHILDETKDTLIPTDILRVALGAWRHQELTRT